MLKKTIKYTDYNGVERTENFYFNINKAELVEMEFGETGGFRQMIQLMVERQDLPKIMKELKQIILRAYGEKSPDGREFVKSEALSKAFSQTEAYNNLFIELMTNPEAAATFINGIFPEDVVSLAEDKKEEPKSEEPSDHVTVLHPEPAN